MTANLSTKQAAEDRTLADEVIPYSIDDHIRVVVESGEFLGEITINPEKNYQTMARQPDEN